MSLQHAAKHLEKHGRNGDTVLVHMSKGEVKSLNDIAMAGGGQLTINPHTGLPEASFLKRMLPMVIGAGLAATGVGAPMAALMVGGGYTAATGSLKKGLMAGLGAYGGAGLAGSLTAAGAPSVATEAAAAPAATPAAVPPAPAPIVDASNYPRPPLFEPPVPVTSSPAISTSPAPTVETLPSAPAPAPVGGYPRINFPAQLPESASVPVAEAAPAPAVDYTLTNRAPGYSSLNAPLDTSAPRMANYDLNSRQAPMEGNYNLARSVPSPAATATANPPALSPDNMTTAQRFEAMKKGATFDNLTKFAKENPMQAYSLAASAFMPEEKAREKKPVDSDPGQQFDYVAGQTSPTPMSDPYGTEQKYYNQRYVARAADGGMMASGGISDAAYNLGGYSDGGRLLRGPGDGVSDSIPAVIGKRQPARLADGEFVVPARIVSELGNGSTEAGARKLYAMMDRIQKARGKTVGKGKVAKNSRSEKYLPA
jgi:hypothetical protein